MKLALEALGTLTNHVDIEVLDREVSEGLEAIAFQINSNLGKELVNWFQGLIDVGDSFTAKYLQAKDKQYLQQKLQHLESYVMTSGQGQKLAEIVTKYTGVKVLSIVFNTSMDNVGAWFMAPVIGSNFEAHLRNQRVPDLVSEKEITQLKRALDQYPDRPRTFSDKELVDLATSFDKDLGKNKGKLPVECIVGIDLISATCIKDLLPKDFEPMSARECTGILLHEIGHITILLERASTSGIMINRIDDIVVRVSNNKDIVSKLEIVEPLLKNPAFIKWLGPKTTKALIDICIGAKPSNTALATTVMGKIQAAGRFALSFVKLMGIVVGAGIVFFMTNTIGIALSVLQWTDESRTTKNIVKSADARRTMRNFSYIEKLCDEYTTRHGFGADLSAGMSKLSDLDRYENPIIGYGMYAEPIRNGTESYILMKATTWILQVVSDNPFSIIPKQHEDDIQRHLSIAKSIIPIFKNSKVVPPIVLQEYLTSYDTVTTLVKRIKAKETITVKAVRMMFFVSHYIFDALKKLLTNQTDKKYEQLLDQIDSQINNPLFVVAAKFDTRLIK